MSTACLLCSSKALACEIDLAQLPKCPTPKTTLAPKHFPPTVAWLTSGQGAYTSTEQQRKILLGLEGEPTRISLSKYDLDDLLKDPSFKKKYEQRGLSKNIMVGGLHRPRGSKAFDRDMHVYSYDQSNQRIHLTRMLPRKTGESSFEACGQKIHVKNMGSQGNQTLGGNIMALPDGTCVYSSYFEEKTLKSICGENKTVKLENKSRLGHLDEILNITRNSNLEKPCDFSIYMADPEQTIKALRAAPNDLFTSPEIIENLRNRISRSITIRYNFPREVCGMMRNALQLKDLDESLYRLKKKSKDGKAYFWFLKSQWPQKAHAGAAVVRERTAEEKLKLARDKSMEEKLFGNVRRIHDKLERGCPISTNEDIARYLDAKEAGYPNVEAWLRANKTSYEKSGLKNSEVYSVFKKIENLVYSRLAFQKRQARIQSMQNANWDELKKHLPQECKRDGKLEHLRKKLAMIQGSYSSLNPNPTNFFSIGKTAQVPKQFNKAMWNSISKQLKSAGIEALPVDTTKAHSLGGNAHCMSNEVRLCRP